MLNPKCNVSIIIPAFNRAKQLRNCLVSLYKQDVVSKEIIVIDDGSIDDTCCMVRNLFPGVMLITHDRNKGASISKNEGANLSNGEYLWFLDSDSIVENRHCLRNMLNILGENSCVGCLGGEYVYKNDKRIFSIRRSFLLNGATCSVIKNEGIFLEKCSYVPTCNCIIKKNIFYLIGGFDPSYFIYSEDCELGYKINKHGLTNVIDERVSVLHNIDFNKKVGSLFTKNRNRVKFVLKNYDFLSISALFINDLAYLLNIKKAESIIKDEPNFLKYAPLWLRPWMKKKSHEYYLGFFLFGIYYSLSLLYAYIWNIVHLKRTISDRHRKSFLM